MGTKRVESPQKPASKLPLHLANSIDSLEKLVKKDETMKHAKNIRKLPQVLKKLKIEIFNQAHDQEKCFLLCKRYVYIVELLYKLDEDPKYIHSMFSLDLEKVKKLLFETTMDLRERYFEQEQNSFLSDSTPLSSVPSKSSTVTDPGEHAYIKPTTSEQPPFSGPSVSESLEFADGDPNRRIFKDSFIKPVDLYYAIIEEKNLLILDVRLSSEFYQCRIIIKKGTIINIPPTLIVSGDSGNTLGKKLDKETQLVWQRRETFEGIVILDNKTVKYDYLGSKVALLRTVLVEWDINKKYKQEPVILNGGLREFIEWYPSLVTNKLAFLIQLNEEIEELLDIESIVYPEAGSTIGPRNVKKYSLYSLGNLHEPIIRGFGSQPNFPLGTYESQEILPGPVQTISDTILTHQTNFTEAVSDLSEVVAKKPKLIEDKDKEIRGVIQENRESLLKEARAVKPKTDFIETMVFEHSKKIQPKDISHAIEGMEFELSGVEITTKQDVGEKPDISSKPAVDRTQKPATVPMNIETHNYPCPGDGYTGLVNIDNNCYMNTILQSMKVIPIIKQIYVTSNMFSRYTSKKHPNINSEFAAAMVELWKGTEKQKRKIILHDFKIRMGALNPIYNLGHHEDAFEFFTFLFNQISLDCEYEIPKPNVMTDSERAWIGHLGGRSSFYTDLFFCQTKSNRVCRKCKKNNLSFDMDNTLMLSLPETYCTLEGLIWDYFKDATIPDFACTKCKTIGSFVHQKEIALPPDVLVIVLKRYRVARDGTISKNKVPVLFPKNNLRFGNANYRLYSIPQHSGTIDSGHYFTTVLLDDTKDVWVTFNDELCIPAHPTMSENDGMASNCVGFFYVKNNCDKS